MRSMEYNQPVTRILTLQYQTIALALLVILAALITSKSLANEAYPHREKYPHINTVSVEELKDCYDSCRIIDVRTRLEYDVIHINNAKNYNMSKPNFMEYVRNTRAEAPDARLIFYCNGHSCEKSYMATQLAVNAGLENVAAFDSGIFDWAMAYSDLTTLLGRSPAETSKIISKAAFKSVLIDYDEVLAAAKQADTVVIDVRENFQRDVIPKIPGLKHIPLNILQTKLLSSSYKNKNLIFIDAVGKQVKWLQYYLNKFGYKNYRFLAKGVNNIPEYLR